MGHLRIYSALVLLMAHTLMEALYVEGSVHLETCLMKVAGETGLDFINQWDKQSISVPTQIGTPLFPPRSHFVSFTVAWSVP